MMTKTTLYLTEEIRSGIKRRARRNGCSEAAGIRQALADYLARQTNSREPQVGFIDSSELGAAGMSQRVDELLEGFGER